MGIALALMNLVPEICSRESLVAVNGVLGRNGEKSENSAWYNMERQEASIIDKKIKEQTKVEDILATIKKKKWSWAGNVMCRTDNRWKYKVTDRQHRNYRSQGRQRTRWRNEIRAFALISFLVN